MFRYIRKHHLFASFASYSLQKYSHKFEYKYSICCKANTFSHTSEYLLQNSRFEATIRKYLSEFHIQANIRLQIFAY